MNKNYEAIAEELSAELGKIDLANVAFVKGDIFSVERKNDFVTVTYRKKSEIARAFLVMKSYEGEFRIEEQSDFDEISILVDCSRNAVKTVETVKKLIRNLAALGYDSLMLYTEDTYEVDNEPVFGYLRGRYSKSEMKELDEYARLLGIELIPAIQTLAHLNQLTRYKYSAFKCFDCEDILFVGEERTYRLIDNMLKTLSECFSSRRVHIGMDEAWLLGRGNYLTKHGYKDPFEIILGHLYKVCALADKYGFQPVIWSDMFWRLCEHDPTCKDEKGKIIIPERVLKRIPQNLVLCHWDYDKLEPDKYAEKLEIHKQFENPVYFAGGTAWGNRGILPHLSYSFRVSGAAIEEAKKFKIKTLIETVWGDNGGECSLFALLPALAHYSYTARGACEERLKNEFGTLTGYDFDDFIKLEYGQTFCGKFTEDICNPAKYGLYNDVFTGFLDTVIIPEDKKYFKKAKSAVKPFRAVGKYAVLFETAYRLNDLLSIKYSLGVELRKAYLAGDRAKLQGLALTLKAAIAKTGKLTDAYRNQWYAENKPNGFEIQEIRLGGLKERLKGCLKRLTDYLDGKVPSLSELEEKLVPEAVRRDNHNGRCDEFSHEAIASVNAFDGFTEVDV